MDITRLRTARDRRGMTMLPAVFAATAALVAASGTAQELTILRYEPLAGLTVTGSADSADGAASATLVSFSAFEKRFALRLTRNEALTRNLSPEAMQRLAEAATFFTGGLEGKRDSWVRLTRSGTVWSGAIWDGAELYAIEPFGRVAVYAIAGVEVDPEDAVIYRWSDTLSVVTDLPVSPAAPTKSVTRDLRKAFAAETLDAATAQLKLTPARQIDIGLLADSEFVQMNGSATAEIRMLSIANIVDGIFLHQVGVHINVAGLRTYAEPDAFSGTDAPALLDQLAQFKFDTPELRSRGVVHLLTGRDLDERPGAPAGSRLRGIANFGAVCDERLAVSLTQYTDLSSTAVVATHEIAHNFGAPHDTEPPCESAGDGFIMNPFLNGSRQFSECSVQQMELELGPATCLADIPPNDLSVLPLSSPTQVVATREFDIEFAVDYGGAGDALNPQLTMTATNARFWSIQHVGVRVECRDSDAPVPNTAQTCTFFGLSAGGGRVTFGVRLFETKEGPVSVDVEVTSLNDQAPANNRYRFDLTAAPDSRFVRTSVAAPIAVKPQQTFEIDSVVTNQGPIPATNARAELRLSHELELIEVRTPSVAACVAGPVAHEAQWFCPVGTMAPGASVPLKLTVRAIPVFVPPPGSSNGSHVSLRMTADEPIFDWRNEWQDSIAITPVIVDLYIVDVTAPEEATVGSDVTITLRIANRGPDAAPNAGAQLRRYGDNELAFNSATSSRGTCVRESSVEMDCNFGPLPSGETIEVVTQATLGMEIGHASLEATAGSADAFDVDQENAGRLFEIFAEEAPPPPPPPAPPPAPNPAPPAAAGGGGGGGSIDLALLLLIAGSAVYRSAKGAQREGADAGSGRR